MRFTGKAHEMLELQDMQPFSPEADLSVPVNGLQLIWFGKGEHHLLIDAMELRFKEGDIVFLTEFHRITIKKMGEYRLLRFNRPFFCILDHDSDVGCKGILFFGASRIPVVQLTDSEDALRFERLWLTFLDEMAMDDELKLDMLQMMLKRFLILSARLYKKQHGMEQMDQPTTDLVREFNYLVELHFREKHTVAEYAELLFKSPKTLSNVFAKMSPKTPMQYIQDRIMLEARRMLAYTEKPVKEIAYELGYSDIQSFSRFFRSKEGQAPSEYRTAMQLKSVDWWQLLG